MQALPKLIAVVGAKHTGKTTIIEHILTELKSRSYRVGAIKEMVRIPTLDTPEKETDRYSQAGAETVVAVPRDETVVFIKKNLSLKEILPYLAGLDYVLVEGFEHEQGLPKIIAARTIEDIKPYLDGSFAISGPIAESVLDKMKAAAFELPLFNSLTEAKKLASLIEQKAAASNDAK